MPGHSNGPRVRHRRNIISLKFPRSKVADPSGTSSTPATRIGNTNEHCSYTFCCDRPSRNPQRAHRGKRRPSSLQRCHRHDLSYHRRERNLHHLRRRLSILPGKGSQRPNTPPGTRIADSEQHLSSIEQRYHHLRLAFTKEREHEKIQLLVVGNDCTGSLLPARDRSGVASLDPRQRPHNPNEPFWHNLLLARRLARLSRHYWLACTVNCNGVRHYGRGQTGTCRTRARAGALLAFRRCGLGGRIHGCLHYWTLTRRTLA